MARPEDMVLAFDGEAPPGCFEVAIPAPPSDDPFIRQELTETYYHLLWELVHVFFEHGGRQSAGGGAASFLYPFLDDKATDVDALLADVARSVRDEGRRDRRAARADADRGARRRCARRRRSCARGSTPAGRCSRSATAARPPTRWTWSPTSAPRGRRALDLTEDPAIITALANDIGTDAIFSRQVIAYGGPGDALIALSTSGNSGVGDHRAGRGAQARADDDRAASATAAGGWRRRRSPTTSSSPAPSTSRGSRRRRRARTTCSASLREAA